MASFFVLTAEDKAGRAVWRDYLRSLPAGLRDIHYDPEYCRIYAGSGTALCAVYESNQGYVIEPFIRTRKNELVSPYGYGGPLSNCQRGELTSAYQRMIANFTAKTGIARKWCRLHPFLAEHQAKLLMQPYQQEKMVAYMDLAVDPESELRKGHRSSVKLARESGVVVEPSDDIELFHDMYLTMLDRHEDVGERFFFGTALLHELSDAYPEEFAILIAKVDGKPEAGCVLLGGHGTCYYHYAGSFGLHRSIGVGNLLVVEAARTAKRKGYQRLHLGGGTTTDPDDLLLRFKGGFSPLRAWTYTCEYAMAEAA